MRPLPIVLALAVLSLAPQAQAHIAGLTTHAQSPRLLDLKLSPAIDDLTVFAGAGSDGSQVASGMLLTVGGTLALVTGGALLIAAAFESAKEPSSWDVIDLTGIFVLMGVPLVVIGIVALAAGAMRLSSATGGGGDFPMAVLPATRPATERRARVSVAPAPVSYAWAF